MSALDLLGRLGRALGQRPHLRGDHGEAAAGLARPRRLDAGVEGQKIGLEGDLVDDADDLADLLRGFLDPGHRLHRLAHDDAALVGVALGGRTTSRACLAPSAVFLTVAVISSSAAAVSSRLAACCSVRRDRSSAADGDLAGARADRLRIDADRRHRLLQRLHRCVEVGAKPVERGNEFPVDALLQNRPRPGG